MSGPRETILNRVRAAVASREPVVHPGSLVAEDRTATEAGATRDPGDLTARLARFTGQFTANGGEVLRFESGDAAGAWLDDFARDYNGVAAGRGLPTDLVPSLPSLPAESAGFGVSQAIGAAAETGTLLLDSGEGRRHQLLPPVHVVWVRATDIEWTLGKALARLSGRPELPAAIGLHSAPSKSADIGRILVVGVHGPGRVIAAIIDTSEGT